MAKNTWRKLKKDDPIFSGQVEISPLQSRPSNPSSSPSTDGPKPATPSQDPNTMASRLYEDAIEALGKALDERRKPQ